MYWNLFHFSQRKGGTVEISVKINTYKSNKDNILNAADLTKQKAWGLRGAWCRHQMETFSALLALCAGNSPVPGEFLAQSPLTQSFDVFFDLHPNKRLSKQWWGWWFETPSSPLWRHYNVSNNCANGWWHSALAFICVTTKIYERLISLRCASMLLQSLN